MQEAFDNSNGRQLNILQCGRINDSPLTAHLPS